MDPTKHMGDCTIYARLVNQIPEEVKESKKLLEGVFGIFVETRE